MKKVRFFGLLFVGLSIPVFAGGNRSAHIVDVPLKAIGDFLSPVSESRPDVAFSVFSDESCAEAIGAEEGLTIVSKLINDGEIGPLLSRRAIVRPNGTYRTAYAVIDLYCSEKSADTIVAVLRKPISGRCDWAYRAFGLTREEGTADWTLRFPGKGTVPVRLFGCFGYWMSGFLRDDGAPWAFIMQFEETGGNTTVLDLTGDRVFEGSADARLIEEDDDVVLYLLSWEAVTETEHNLMTYSKRQGKRRADGPKSKSHQAVVFKRIDSNGEKVLAKAVYPVGQESIPKAVREIVENWEMRFLLSESSSSGP